MARFPARIFGADRLARRFAVAARQIPHDLDRELEAMGDVSEVIYRGHAQRDTGRLHRGIQAHRTGGHEVTVRADAVDPESGYDYVGVTRFGHRQSRIYPRRARALRFEIGGRVLYRASVRGYSPGSDWAMRAYPAISRQAEVSSDRLGRRIAARVA